MKVVIPGGSGQVGALLVRSLTARGDDVVVLSRAGTSGARVVAWDGRTPGAWAREIDGADAWCRHGSSPQGSRSSSRPGLTRQATSSTDGGPRGVGADG